MSYTPFYGSPGSGTGWEDGPVANTPVDAAALDNMEAGIIANDAAITALAPQVAGKVGLDSQVYDVTNNQTGHQITAGSGAGDQAPALNALIAAVPPGSRLYVPPGSYYLASGIEFLNRISIEEVVPFTVHFKAMPGFSDNQMLRNWRASEYTSGETDHRLAPTTCAVAFRNYYVNFSGDLDVNGNSNIDCMSLVHLQERSRIRVWFNNTPLRKTAADGNTVAGSPNISAADGGFTSADVGRQVTGTGIPNNTTILSVTDSTDAVMSANATATAANIVFSIFGGGNRGLVLFANGDADTVGAAGNSAGRYVIDHMIQYGGGWANMIYADGSNGGKQANGMINDLKITNISSAPGGAGANYSDSPVFVRNASNVFLDLHVEGQPPEASSDTAIIRLIDVAGCRITGTANSGGYDRYHPVIRATSTGTLAAPWVALPPTIDDLNMGGTNHSNVGNVIEDETPINGVATSRHFASSAAAFTPSRIVHYDGASMRWIDKTGGIHDDRLPDIATAPSTALAETMPRLRVANAGLTITSGRLLLVRCYLYAGQVVTSIKWISNTTALATGSNQWAALFDPSRNKLAVSADDTGNAWAASTQKAFTLTAPYTITVSGWYYLGLCVVAATPPTLIAHDIPQTLNSITPVYAGNADTGLTNPASCPTTATSPTGTAGLPYAYVS